MGWAKCSAIRDVAGIRNPAAAVGNRAVDYGMVPAQVRRGKPLINADKRRLFWDLDL